MSFFSNFDSNNDITLLMSNPSIKFVTKERNEEEKTVLMPKDLAYSFPELNWYYKVYLV